MTMTAITPASSPWTRQCWRVDHPLWLHGGSRSVLRSWNPRALS